MDPSSSADAHVAVVFVHGIGEQRRHEDVARLVTALTRRAAERGATMREPEVRRVRDPAASPQETRPRTVASIETDLAGHHVRFHDVYWAPFVAGRTSFRSLQQWLRSKLVHPVSILLAPWASHAHVKLMVLQEPGEPGPVGLRLVTDYLGFVEKHQRESGGRASGQFPAFLAYLEALDREGRGGGIPLGAKQDAARAWLRRYWWAMWRSILGVGIVWVGLTGLVLDFALTGPWLAERLTHGPRGAELVGMLGVGLVWILVPAFLRLVTTYVGDVEVYATYIETSERRAAHDAVIAEALRTLRRILVDPACSRVVLVAHSLGSVVAWDSVRALALEAAVAPQDAVPLRKLDRLVTFGSPIDKIDFFHFSDDRNDPTFRLVLERLRVDLRFGALGVSWDNFYDPADVIGGRLESPNDPYRTDPVRNRPVANGVLPNPFTSHAGYLRNPVVLDAVLAAIANAPPPAAPIPAARKLRATATWLEIAIAVGLVVLFFGRELWPLVLAASSGEVTGWVALFTLLAVAFWMG